MHREYRPADFHRLRAGAFGGGSGPGHDHGHDHHHDHHHHDHHQHDHHQRDDRGLYALTLVMGLLLGGELLFDWLGWEPWRAPGGVSLALIAAVIGGSRIVHGAIEALLHREIGADVALAQACLAALIIGQPFVAAEVVFIALVGEVLEAVTFSRTQKAIQRLVDQTPRTARVRRDGTEVEIPAEQVLVGDLVIVRPGERVPVDGKVVVGRTSVDQSALTGESLPVDRGPGESVFTGTLNQFGLIEIQAEKVGHETTLGQVLRLVAEAQQRKAPLERTADRLARWFLPVVEVVAGLTLLAGYVLGWPDVWFRAVAVLVVACPCALILATPAAVLASMAWLARHGILIKGGAALERLAACDTLAFDKTGTLTRGTPELASVLPLGGTTEARLLELAATAESTSEHPLARAVTREAERRSIPRFAVAEAQAHPGAGVSARFQDPGVGRDSWILVGNARLLAERGVALPDDATSALATLDERGETPLLVVADGQIVGALGVRDSVRPEAHDVVHDLKHLKFTTVAILTGDRANAARLVAKKTHIKHVEAELLPADKAAWVTRARGEGKRVAMVGDGINDAPALAAADVGIALAGIGSDLAAEAGDILVLGEPLLELPGLVSLARATVQVIRQNIILFAFGLNAVAMSAAALGVLGPVPAAILHQAGSFLVLLNAMRLLAHGEWSRVGPARWARSLGESIARLDDRLDPGHLLARCLDHWRRLLAGAAILGVLGYAFSGVHAIPPDELGVTTRLGRFVAVLGPGLHWRWPSPIEEVRRIQAERARSTAIGFRTGSVEDRAGIRWDSPHGRSVTARAEDESLLLTGDGQLVELTATVQYRVARERPESLRAYAFDVADPDQALLPLAEGAIRAVVGRMPLEAVLTRRRREVETALVEDLQRAVDRYGLGLRVLAVSFQDVHPPLSVLDSFRDVARAESDRQRRANEAGAHEAEAIASARGKAAALLERAEAARAVRVERASSEADAFRYRSEARAGHPSLTDTALYWDALGQALAGRPKVLLDPGRAAPRHLILPEFGAAAVPAAAVVGPPRPSGDGGP